MIIIKWDNLFQYILGLSALFVAAVAAFFSVMGIGMLFSGAAISATTMATSLEVGKIVSTTFLYRYWEKATKFLRVYLVGAIFVLGIITSLGVFGWLSSAYQSSSMRYDITQQQISMLVAQRETMNSEVGLSKQRIDSLMSIRTEQEKRMNEALNSPVLSRNPTALRQVQEQNISLIKQTNEDLSTEKAHYNDLIKESMEADKRILEIRSELIKTKDVITFKFVAEALGWNLNTTVKWFIVIIITVFDPLAVCLILAYNVVAYGDKKKNDKKELSSIEKEQILKKSILLDELPAKEDARKITESREPDGLIRAPVTSKEEKHPTLIKPIPLVPLSTPTPSMGHGLHDSEIYHSPTR